MMKIHQASSHSVFQFYHRPIETNRLRWVTPVLKHLSILP